MTSKIKVDNINKVSDDSNIINKCGTTVTVGAASDGVRTGADNLQAADGGNLISQSGTTITLGASGDTITLASGASQSGFGREGSVDWQTGSIKTGTFTAASGEGYFVDTSSGAVTANLPAGTAGAIVAFADYTRTFATHNLTLTPNGSNKIGGIDASATLDVNGQSATFVFVDATEGWINVQETQTSQAGVPPFIQATGGTITCSGNCRIHTFTGPGTFAVSSIASCCAPVNNLVSFLVVAGGGGGAHGQVCRYTAGGGGAGGVREVVSPGSPYTGSPLNGYPTPGNRITVTATSFPITVGAGGAEAPPTGPGRGEPGSVSTFSTISSAGGGYGGNGDYQPTGDPGGSGGGGSGFSGGGSGNQPPVTPAQGKSGGNGCGVWGSGRNGGGGGGGASQCGSTGSSSVGGAGGSGIETNIPGGPLKVGGGGQGSSTSTVSPCAPFTDFGGGAWKTAGTANTGGGGGGGAQGGGPGNGRAGGSGIVIIRYKKQ